LTRLFLEITCVCQSVTDRKSPEIPTDSREADGQSRLSYHLTDLVWRAIVLKHAILCGLSINQAGHKCLCFPIEQMHHDERTPNEARTLHGGKENPLSTQNGKCFVQIFGLEYWIGKNPSIATNPDPA